MKFNTEFFKTLNILYVGDNELIGKEFLNKLKDLFKNLFLYSDALSALEYFFKNQNTNNQIDVIISETILVNLNSLDFLLKIREFSKNIPFIFVSETLEKEFLLNALRYELTDYFVRPFNELELLKKIEKSSLEKQKKNKILEKQNDIEEYLELINKVAIVFMFDSNKNIFYANDFFKELIKYEDEDLIGEDYRRFFYEVSKLVLEEQNVQLSNANKWQGKIKFLSSINSVFYTNCTIIPIIDENKEIKKNICINFLTTREENEKREFKKRVFFSLQETKKIYFNAQKKIDELNNILQTFSDFDLIRISLEKEKKVNKIKYLKLENLENKLKEIKQKNDFLTKGINKKITEISTMTVKIQNILEKVSRSILEIEEKIKIKNIQISKIENIIKNQGSKIRELELLLKNQSNNKVGI